MTSRYFFRRSGAIALTALTLGNPGASAQAITATLLDGETDIINTGGTLISAVHFQDPGSGDPSPLVVNGIPHIVGRNNESKLTSNFGFEGDFRNGASGLPADGSDIIQILLSGIAGANGMTMEITGLEIGRPYLFQTYWEAPVSHTLTLTFEGETIDDVAAQQAPPDTPGGTLISYEFTASDTIFSAFIDRDDAGADTGDPNNWLSGYSLQEITSSSVAITSITSIGNDLWELTLKGGANTAYELRSSPELDFNPGSLVENLAPGIPASGTIGGPDSTLLITDTNGTGRVRIQLADPVNFIIATLPTLAVGATE